VPHEELPGALGRQTHEEVVADAHARPLDSDIIHTRQNLENTEKTLGHKWQLPKAAGLAALGSDMRSDPPWNSHDGYELGDHQSA